MTGDPRHPPLPGVVATAESELARVPRFEPDLGEHPNRAVRPKHVSAQVGVLRAKQSNLFVELGELALRHGELQIERREVLTRQRLWFGRRRRDQRLDRGAGEQVPVPSRADPPDHTRQLPAARLVADGLGRQPQEAATTAGDT